MALLWWFAITAALSFGCSLGYHGSFNRPGLVTTDSLAWGLPVKRDSEREGSCSQSTIQQNVTLKGGIRAGYFRKLAQYVAMQLCVDLCCEEKGCDVAFMSGKNCFGVQCFSEDQCQTIPAKKPAPEPIYISQVTIKGEGAHKPPEPTNLQCSATRMKVGVTLRGGLKAGNFTDVGQVDNMVICTKLCCVAEKCDLALMINNNCFLVSCYSRELCEVVKAISTKYQPSVAYVMRRTGQLKNDTATKLQALHTSDSKLMCKNSHIFYNSTLRGGYNAGNFTDFGKVANMSACIRLCCGDKECHAAFMLESNCYAVSCGEEDLCTPVHAKKSGALIALNPKLSYITSRSEEVVTKHKLTDDGSCHAGVISYDVTLRGGMTAGNFTPHGKVDSMETCITKCCLHKKCNAAMMLKDACFTVECSKDEFCEKKPIPTSSNFNPRIAYVFRDRRPKLQGKPAAKKHSLSALLKHIQPEPPDKYSKSTASDFKKINEKPPGKHFYSSNDSFVTDKKNNNSTERLSQLLNQTTYSEDEIRRTSIDVIKNLEETDIDNNTKVTGSESVPSIMPGLSFIDEDPGCTNSEIMRNVTLRGGITSGRFKDRGKITDIRECLKICCLAKTCDLAFMLEDNCFSVECISEKLCEVVPARSAKYSPAVAYIYARTTITKRIVRAPERDNWMIETDETRSNSIFILKRKRALLLKHWTGDRTIQRLRDKIPNG